MSKVKIISDECVKDGVAVTIEKTRCFVDGVEIPRVISADFHISADEVPTFKFETIGRPDINMLGQVSFDFSPENLSDACLIVSEELKKHGDFYKAFVDSVKSALREVPEGVSIQSNAVAVNIVRRIAGEE